MFEDIRPYNDSEISSAMQRIVDNPHFPKLASFVFPHLSTDETREMVLGINNIDEYQGFKIQQPQQQ